MPYLCKENSVKRFGFPESRPKDFPTMTLVGSKTVAYDVGESGEKNKLSWPNVREVVFPIKFDGRCPQSDQTIRATPKDTLGISPRRSRSRHWQMFVRRRSFGPEASKPQHSLTRSVAPILGPRGTRKCANARATANPEHQGFPDSNKN